MITISDLAEQAHLDLEHLGTTDEERLADLYRLIALVGQAICERLNALPEMLAEEVRGGGTLSRGIEQLSHMCVHGKHSACGDPPCRCLCHFAPDGKPKQVRAYPKDLL
jgi:hypothetical protein